MTANHTVEAVEEGPATTADRSQVTVDGIERSFGDLEVLSGVSFDVPAGSVACLVGSNGSGKSTLLRIVAGLLAADDGSVTIRAGGERPVGYLAQRPEFRPQFSVSETLSFYGDLLAGEVVVDEALDLVGLAPVADRRVGALSGGMVRLLGLAQATVGDPPLLILDEPSSGLDPTMTRHIGGVIDDLAGAGRSVLLATHDLDTVERVADQVLVLDQGTITARGTPADLEDQTDTDSLADAVPELTRGSGEIGVSAGRRGGDGE
ncbi:ABC transporter ATP-binding protein [Halobacteriales archaeon Cl-PHB]